MVRRLLHAAGIKAPDPVPDDFIRMSDFAELSRRTYDAVRKHVARGKLDSVKVGNEVFVPMSGLAGLARGGGKSCNDRASRGGAGSSNNGSRGPS